MRPDDVIHDSESEQRAEVVAKVFTGTATLYTLQLPTGSVIQSAFPSHHDYHVGDEVGIRIEADHLIVFRREEQSIAGGDYGLRSEEHTSELQSRGHLVCRLLLEKKNTE